ncbi:DEBR0S5_06458g1_1 [Brettanomyces bruxellensis]|uniref:DEBR0S5_06458g1_1 n=1 Tax=Dekkera bruxellensis TaxID=5007 RepID=A0A7D9H225_DEKBR|nr:DEBR0S5_06458g1_1 [Brettanomyces bruxellensis]
MSDKPLNQYACTRCRRLKKKCSKEFPKCANCRKQNKVCEYVERKNKRKRPQPGNGPSKNGSILNGSGFSGTEPPENNNAQIHTQNNNNGNNHLGSGGANLAAMPVIAGNVLPPISGLPQRSDDFLRAFQAPLPLQPQASQSPLDALTAAAPGQPARATSIFSAPGALSTMGPPSIISAPGAGSVIGATNGPPHPGSIAGSAASTTLLPPLGIYSMRQQQSALRGTQKASAPVLNNISSAGDGTLPRIPPVLPLPPALSSSLPQISPMGRGTASFDSSTTFSSSVMQNANNASLVSSSISSQTPDGKEVGASASSGAGAGANANIGAHAQAAPVSSMVNTDEACEKSASAALTASAKSSAHPALNAPATSGAPLVHAAAAQNSPEARIFASRFTSAQTAPGVRRFKKPRLGSPDVSGFISSMKTHKPISPQTNFSASFWPLGSASRSEDSCNTEIVRSMIGLETAHMIEPPSEPTRTVMAAALDAYFAHTQREYPFLEEKVVRRRAHSLHFAGEPSGPALAAAPTAELLLVLALGCRVLESAGTASKVQRYPEFFIRRAQKTLEGPGIALTGVEAVRILALYCAYLVYGTQIAHCWMAVGALGRLVLAANLHRRPGANVRVLFAAYSLDRMVSLTLGRPVCIGDDDVDASLPLRRREESQADIEISKRIIEMYRVEGLIMQNIHAARAVESFGTVEDRRAIYDALRKEVEAWYGRCRGYRAQLAKSALSGMQGGMPGAARTPMHNPTAWFNAEYYNLLIALYKPCRLCAHPAPEIMDLLGRCALQALSFSYSIYSSTWFPCSWVIFYRFLSANRVLLYCLCHRCIDLLQVRTNLPLAREMLDYFASTWPYASQLATVLAKVACCLDDVAQIRQLAVKYQRILTDNSVNLWVEDVGYLDCRS